MRIWAFDPGSVATGVAWLHIPPGESHVDSWEAFQMEDLWDIWETLIDVEVAAVDVPIIEMYRSAGYLNKHAQNTIEAIGALKFMCKSIWITESLMRPEQARLAGQREAAAMMGQSITELRQDPFHKDAFSALSHCCSYRRELLNG